MIAIPNMGMPETCDMCPIEGCEYINGKFTCPLIEIVRCGECKHYGFKETDRGGFPCCTNEIGATPYRMPTDFCNYGERRAE